MGLFEVLFIIKNCVIILWWAAVGVGMMVLVHTFASVPEVSEHVAQLNIGRIAFQGLLSGV